MAVPPASLQELQDDQTDAATQASGTHVTFILIANPSAKGGNRLSKSQWGWLSSIVKQASVTARFYEFQYAMSSNAARIWKHLDDVGDLLFNSLHDIGSSDSQVIGPLVLVTHAFGGFPAKKAITRLSASPEHSYANSLWRRLVLMLNIGCPHPTFKHRNRWPQLDPLLRYEYKMTSGAIENASEETNVAASICSNFSEAGILFKVISTFESLPTKVRHPRKPWKSQTTVLVGRDMAETGVLPEDMIPLDLGSQGLSTLDQSNRNTAPFLEACVSAIKHCEAALSSEDSQSTSQPLAASLFDTTVSPGSQVDRASQARSIATKDQQPSRPLESKRSLSPIRDASKTKQPRLPCYVFRRHPRNLLFQGRSEVMTDIDAHLLGKSSPDAAHEQTTLKTFAICGLGGMGKTQTALEYAYARKNNPFTAIFWVQADKRESIREDFATIATTLGIADKSEVTDLAISFSIVMQWLSDPDSGARWLIVFDNADDLNLLREFWPGTGAGSVLVTTRDPGGIDFCRGMGTMLKPLSRADSLDLFIKGFSEARKNQTRNSSITLDLITRFGGHPLAIVQAAALIQRRSLTVNEFQQAVVKAAGDPEFLALPHDTARAHSLLTTWALESLDDTAQGLMTVMSFLAPFNIPESILIAQHDTDHALPYPSNVDTAYVDARSSLIKSSLLIRDIDSEQVEIHPLVKSVLQDRLPVTMREPYFSLAVSLVLASWPDERVKFGHGASKQEMIGELIPHAIELRGSFEKYSLQLDTDNQKRWVRLMTKCGWYLYTRGEHLSGLPNFQLGLDIARAITPRDHGLLGDVLMGISTMAIHTHGPPGVMEFAKEHLTERQAACAEYEDREVPMQARYDLAMALGQIAFANNTANLFDKALEFAEKSLEMYGSLERYQDWKTVPYFAVSHAGWALWALARYQDAETLILKFVNAELRHKKGGSYGLAAIKTALGNAQLGLKKFPEARKCHEEALEMFHQANGNNGRTSQARMKVAEHDARQGRLDDALNHVQIAIDSFECNSCYRLELARAKFRAAQLHAQKGNQLLSEKLMTEMKEVLRAADKVLDNDVPTSDQLDQMLIIWSR